MCQLKKQIKNYTHEKEFNHNINGYFSAKRL